MVRGRQQTDRRDAGRQASAQRLVIGLVGLIWTRLSEPCPRAAAYADLIPQE